MIRPLSLVLLLLATGVAPAAGQAISRNVRILAHVNEFPNPAVAQPWAYSACWSYVHGDGREYAVLGVAGGTAIYNLSDPERPYRVVFMPGPPSVWREMKSYRNWIYVVSEGEGTGRGLQIVRMTDPERPVLANTYGFNFVRSHTVQVDTARALLICNGTRDASGRPAGMRVLSLADPEHPLELTFWPDAWRLEDPGTYVHDCVVQGTTLYASCIYSGVVRVFDFSEPTLPVEFAAWSYPGASYTHSAWPDSAGSTLYVADERNGQPLWILTPTGPHSAQEVNAVTSNPRAIVHNPRVRGRELFLASYTEGVRVLDISDPFLPAEFAWLDTWPGPSGGYGGVWEVCPYFPSGIVIASDMKSGLWVFRPERNYGLFEVHALGSGWFDPVKLERAELYLGEDSLAVYPVLSAQRFAPDPGTRTVQVRAYGYYPDSVTRTLVAGGSERASVLLEPRPRVAWSGAVRDLLTGAPLASAEVALRYAPLDTVTGPDGRFRLDDVPADRYRVEVRRAGYAPVIAEREVGPGSEAEDFALLPARSWDALADSSGWVVGGAGDGAVQGAWVHATPVAGAGPTRPRRAAAPPLGPAHEEPPLARPPAAPLSDHSPDPDSLCFVTGQAADTADLAAGALARGRTTLTTPELDVTGMREPAIGFWRWFFSENPGTGQPDAAPFRRGRDRSALARADGGGRSGDLRCRRAARSGRGARGPAPHRAAVAQPGSGRGPAHARDSVRSAPRGARAGRRGQAGAHAPPRGRDARRAAAGLGRPRRRRA